MEVPQTQLEPDPSDTYGPSPVTRKADEGVGSET